MEAKRETTSKASLKLLKETLMSNNNIRVSYNRLRIELGNFAARQDVNKARMLLINIKQD